jgi:uncharacterized protein (DUF2147 family)
MKRLIIFLLLISSYSQASNIVGHWETIDENTGRADSVVTMQIIDGKLQGHISQMTDPEVPEGATCDKCSGDRKDAPLVGLVILTGFDCEARECRNGEILDPRSGKVYSSRLKLVDDNTLKVRGYIGTPLLGQSRTWKRATSEK